MNKRDLLLCTILIALSFFSLFSFEKRGFNLNKAVADYQVQAACNYPSTCDPSGTTCNGGAPCYINNTTCSSTYDLTNCGCSNTYTEDCNGGNIGKSCGGSYGHAIGVCGCDTSANRSCTCTDTYWSTCGTGASCGWGDYSACTVACGTGSQSRYNSCTGVTQTVTCNTQTCPAPSPGASAPPSCTFGSWSTCSLTCGGGTQTRTDNCGNEQSQPCNVQACPCTVGSWSACSATCGQGTQTRSNSCESGGTETQTCDTCSLGCACSMACGQSTQCGTCAATDFGQTSAVTLTPSSGNLVMPSDRSVALSWTAATGADSYDVEIYPTGTTAGQECTAANTFCSLATTATSYTFTAPNDVPNYSWRVRTNNTTCDAITYMEASASDEYLISEGAAYNQTAAKAVDGSDATAWNSGGVAPGWIELDLKSARTVSGMRMATNHFPDGAANIEIYAGASASPSALVQTISQTITSGDVLNITFSSPVSNVRYIRVKTTSDVSWVSWAELTPYFSDGIGNWTNGTFALVGPVAGNFYLDQNSTASLNLATGLCEMGGGLTGQDPGTGSAVNATWGTGGSSIGTISGTTYSILNVPNYSNIGITYSPSSTWRCSCPFGCTYSGQNVPVSDVNYFITNASLAWFQTKNGLVYAGSTLGNALVSQVPSTCTGACVGNFSLKNNIAASNSSGISITGGGDIDVDQDNALRYDKLRQDTDQSHVIGSVYQGPKENYTYFYNLYSLGSSPTSDFTGSQPGSAPSNGRAYYAGTSQTISSAWHVTNGQKMVIFVNGNLTISNNIIVDEGGFLAFIVSGDITVSNTVGNALSTDTTPNVEGVFIGDRIIIQGGLVTGDKKFVGQGTFVGWTSVTLGRTFLNATDNDTAPTELFQFRPDFVQNVPERMTRPLYSWQETN